jgi:hypothetical protein
MAVDALPLGHVDIVRCSDPGFLRLLHREKLCNMK